MPGIEKILRGILRYRNVDQSAMVEQFLRVKNNPTPTAIFITCMDSRVLASRFTNSQVGDNFFVRNAGNLIPHAKYFSYESVTTEPGALELACIRNCINHVIVCGHSDCKAMNLLYNVKDECDKHVGTPLEMWLKKHGEPSVEKFAELTAANHFSGPLTFQGETEKHTFEAYIDPDEKFDITDKLSQVNCLQQLQNIASYPFLKHPLQNNDIYLHAMWFDIYTGDVLMFSRGKKRFIQISDSTMEELVEDSKTRQ